MTIRIERMASALDTDSMIIGDVPVEVPNGAIVIFTTTDPYVAGTLKVYRDQLSLQPTVDFVETTPSTGKFTLTVAPLTGEVVWCEYIKQ